MVGAKVETVETKFILFDVLFGNVVSPTGRFLCFAFIVRKSTVLCISMHDTNVLTIRAELLL